MMVRTNPVNAAGWRLVVTTLALIAFAFQGYVTQTHIHFLPPISATTLKAAAASDLNPLKTSGVLQRKVPEKTPSNEDPMKCPLCQAVGYAGHFVTPSSSAPVLLPTTAISILPVALAILSPRETPSHIWQGRGPPHS
jgi:hypothetical protein